MNTLSLVDEYLQNKGCLRRSRNPSLMIKSKEEKLFFLGILTLIGFVDGVTFYNLYFGCPLASIAWPIGNLPIALLQLALCFSIKNVDDKIKDG